MDSEDQEQTLLEVIPKLQKFVDEFNKNTKINMSVVLLIRVTVSGQSSIFNFQCGTDFIINDKNELEINNPSNNFSNMVEGMNSNTTEPNCNNNSQNNHLIIDFPEFKDTNSECDQLLYELLFSKIVTSGSTKVIYVIENPENSSLNRESDLSEFIKQLLLQKNINIQKSNILLNCYLEDLSEEELKDKLKENLRSANILESIDKILVLRKAKRNEEMQQIFNNEQRQILWQQIEQMQSVEIKPQKLPKSEKICNYLRSTTLKTIEKYRSELNKFLYSSCLNLSDAQSEQTQTQLEKLLAVINSENMESPLEWDINFISVCEQLANNLSSQIDIVTSSNNFRQIFTYFSQFSDLIEGYDEMTTIKSIAKDQLKEIIDTRLQLLINKIEQEPQILPQSMNYQKNQCVLIESRLENSQVEQQQQLEVSNQFHCDLEAKEEKVLESFKEAHSQALNQQLNEQKNQTQEGEVVEQKSNKEVEVVEQKSDNKVEVVEQRSKVIVQEVQRPNPTNEIQWVAEPCKQDWAVFVDVSVPCQIF